MHVIVPSKCTFIPTGAWSFAFCGPIAFMHHVYIAVKANFALKKFKYNEKYFQTRPWPGRHVPIDEQAL